ncbi:acidic repeat-containing protein-like [Rana temporaria]|uniref:acidic repeat-containing protein-like n=1 Tax=Rana temporaria TaxID=8407 RepID=UPI001AACAFB5|nr:acidic repeat-containing protein-like [Rana temporaria]
MNALRNRLVRQHGLLETIVHHKWGQSGSEINGTIVSKLRPRLCVIHKREGKLNSQLCTKPGYKLATPVRDDNMGSPCNRKIAQAKMDASSLDVGQDSPIPPIRESRTLIWAREPEEQLLQSFRSNKNPDRNKSTSDQNQAETESVQTPPCNQESNENPDRNDSTSDQNQAEPESVQTPPCNRESDENPDRNDSTSDQNQTEPESVQTPPCNQESDENPDRNDSTSDQNQAEPESVQTPPCNRESNENPDRNDSTFDQNQAEPESVQTPPCNRESDENPDRNDSTSDQNQAEPESVQTPPCNRESDENPDRNDSTSDQNQAEPESVQTPPCNQESDENPDRNDSTSDQNRAEPESVQTPPCNQESDKLPECSVCLLEIEEEDKSSRLPCSDQFHDECITRWIEQSRTCPRQGQSSYMDTAAELWTDDHHRGPRHPFP